MLSCLSLHQPVYRMRGKANRMVPFMCVANRTLVWLTNCILYCTTNVLTARTLPFIKP